MLYENENSGLEVESLNLKEVQRDNVVYWKEPTGRSIMISCRKAST